MSTAAGHHRYTYEEYRFLEEESSIRHEYLGGEIYAMAGGTPEHARLAAAIIEALGRTMRRGCHTFTSDLRVRVPASGLSTYPDAAVVCGPTERAHDDPLAVVNPVLLVEVTSSSTEEYDRGEKLEHYQKLPSLREVLIASHQERRLTLHRREGETWRALSAGRGEALPVASVGGEIAVDDVYEGVENLA
jgi:Uma2 family endonuclease